MENTVQKLKKLIDTEKNATQHSFGAVLQHWSGVTTPILLDQEALIALVRHYERRMKREHNSEE